MEFSEDLMEDIFLYNLVVFITNKGTLIAINKKWTVV